jgi:hypothetical protein
MAGGSGSNRYGGLNFPESVTAGDRSIEGCRWVSGFLPPEKGLVEITRSGITSHQRQLFTIHSPIVVPFPSIGMDVNIIDSLPMVLQFPSFIERAGSQRRRMRSRG